jgi:acyl-CoA hydrolase
LRQGLATIDVALIQTSPPDSHGYVSLGISVDIVKAAIEQAAIVILTGQATAESLGQTFYSGIGGQADFMRGTVWSPHGKNIRERAMEPIAIAHPKFRLWLIEEAKKRHLIYADQAFIPGQRGEYPEEVETYRTTKTGLEIFLRPVKISDEPLLKDFFLFSF